MSKLIPVGIMGLLMVAAGGLVLLNRTNSKARMEISVQPTVPLKTSIDPVDKRVNVKASFAIFTHGTFRVFTAVMYHNLSKDVYIEAASPNIIKVKKEGITWNDFFSTLPFKLTDDCLTTGTKEIFCSNNVYALKFYLNGERKSQILDQVIQEGDTLLITYGNESEAAIEKQKQRVSSPW